MKLKINSIKKRIQTNKQQLKEWKSNLIKKNKWNQIMNDEIEEKIDKKNKINNN
jgi:chromosome segregation ATPase